ncbi:MAG: hypothetical protein HQK49_08195 [Oligoflexia bacterium]|nr:hypothetical protein [Oligoflexia bacterium]
MKHIFLFIIILFSNIYADAQALVSSSWGVILNPMAGVQKGIWKNQRTNASYDGYLEGNTSGVIYGTELSMFFRYLFAGMDYMQGKLFWTYNPSESENVDDQWKKSVSGTEDLISGIIGIHLMKGRLGLWGGYIFKHTIRFDDNIDPSLPEQTIEGTGLKIGIGAHFFKQSRVRFNVVYMKSTFNKMTEGGCTNNLPGNFSGGTYQKYYLDRLLFYLSIPWGHTLK